MAVEAGLEAVRGCARNLESRVWSVYEAYRLGISQDLLDDPPLEGRQGDTRQGALVGDSGAVCELGRRAHVDEQRDAPRGRQAGEHAVREGEPDLRVRLAPCCRVC